MIELSRLLADRGADVVVLDQVVVSICSSAIVKSDLSDVQLLDRVDQVPEPAAEAIRAPRHLLLGQDTTRRAR